MHSELDRLLNASVDGELSDADESTLQTLLRDNAAARQRYLQFMQLHADLHWDHGAAASLLVSPEDQPTDVLHAPKPMGRRVSGWMTMAIALGAVAVGWLLALGYFNGVGDASHGPVLNSPTIASAEVQGTASFRPISGESIILADRHRELPAGTLLVEGETSVAQWQFLDGTTIAVSGDAEVSFSDEGQKQIHLRQGMLTADVQPQPADEPLVIETSTARVEVLGTVFTLAAESDETRIDVAEGRVRMQRLVDGETVEVSQQHRCVASLDARRELLPETPGQPSLGWRHHFNEPPPERWKGEWLPAEGDLPARVKAVACLVGRKHEADGTPIVHYGVTARRIDGMSLGSLPKAGVLRVRFRSQDSARLHIMLGLHHADGRFAGNFEAKLPHDAGMLQSDGWRKLIVPLTDFRPLVQRKPEMPDNARPYLILITTYGDDAGLEVCELAIEPVQTSGVR